MKNNRHALPFIYSHTRNIWPLMSHLFTFYYFTFQEINVILFHKTIKLKRLFQASISNSHTWNIWPLISHLFITAWSFNYIFPKIFLIMLFNTWSFVIYSPLINQSDAFIFTETGDSQIIPLLCLKSKLLHHHQAKSHALPQPAKHDHSPNYSLCAIYAGLPAVFWLFQDCRACPCYSFHLKCPFPSCLFTWLHISAQISSPYRLPNISPRYLLY